ncbi:MAG: carboxypeptidase-like regulatory domain-containing protein [Sphingobacteriaceae bacterium]
MYKKDTKKVNCQAYKTLLKPNLLKNLVAGFLLVGSFQVTAAHAATSALSSGPYSSTLSKSVSLKIAEVTVRGKVTDDKKEPLPGVTVSVKSSKAIAVTDMDGNYSITALGEGEILIFNMIGFAPQEIAITGTILDVILIPSLNNLDEVVVVGFGTQKKVNLTGAVAQISSEVLENRPSPNLTRML